MTHPHPHLRLVRGDAPAIVAPEARALGGYDRDWLAAWLRRKGEYAATVGKPVEMSAGLARLLADLLAPETPAA